MKKALTENKGGHRYSPAHYGFECMFGCGCWKSNNDKGGPEGLDPLKKCPKNPKNTNRGVMVFEM